MTPAITAELLAIAWDCSTAAAQKWVAPLIDACSAFGINTPARLAAFLAQTGHESGGGHYVREVWGPTDAQLRYEGREDLGNTLPGDGFRFRGRGLIQTTGRANYRHLRDRLRKGGYRCPDFEQEPERLEDPQWAALSAADRSV